MEILFELLGEILFEIIGAVFEAGTSSKAPKWVRYTLTAILILLLVSLSVGPIILGLLRLKEDAAAGWTLIVTGVILGGILIGGVDVKKFKKTGGEELEQGNQKKN